MKYRSLITTFSRFPVKPRNRIAGRLIQHIPQGIISSSLRIYSFSLHHRSPAVMRLALHLPDRQQVFFNEDDTLEDVLLYTENDLTTLNAYFILNRKDKSARHLCYH
ncbi:uncharacterized protein BYT42DRAFT_632092 [Radiomyces spectabilis]|uniref:uncharacterized protein n=1 Tax=Radiomyces spectabilis TaxID=64574 RepID=UPI002220A683|nr:uncharacterized protein BYT42DRAFT_632092 [Radiomyces spectabilis]KAI8388855.1 hypothetical protein BYT42DRAFT_632092 [Radiomyces spectabilis]